MAEDEHIFLPDRIDDFDGGSVVRSDEQASVQRALHVAISHSLPWPPPRAAGFRARSANMLRYVSCGNDQLCGADAVVRDENHSQIVGDFGVFVHDLTHIID